MGFLKDLVKKAGKVVKKIVPSVIGGAIGGPIGAAIGGIGGGGGGGSAPAIAAPAPAAQPIIYQQAPPSGGGLQPYGGVPAGTLPSAEQPLPAGIGGSLLLPFGVGLLVLVLVMRK